MRNQENIHLYSWQQNRIFFSEISGLFLLVFSATKLCILNETSGHFVFVFVATESDILSQNMIFIQPSVFCPLIQPDHKHKINNQRVNMFQHVHGRQKRTLETF